MTFKSAKIRYRSFLVAARDAVELEWKAKYPSIRIVGIDQVAIKHANERWVYEENRPRVFNWFYINEHYSKYIRKIDVAIWHGADLCGMAIGKASRGKNAENSNVTIEFIQGAPGSINPIKGNVAPISVEVFNNFGFLTDKRVVYLESPLPAVVPYYTNIGFSIDASAPKGLRMKKEII
ncbi:hypothetical protein HLH36_16725 [Gluconacetobacter aggeris]|uniref:Uncharacterized protein n=1 Tax=Gluconacetobacter aggeris TaxID=1286186 RepID=A0A7W4IVS1_9PROT|nr:hypothetical protein [Gluconacetobacter aggeris]MBB2169969.1 hypothetical protein [Gluconacetobacter aggeris]